MPVSGLNVPAWESFILLFDFAYATGWGPLKSFVYACLCMRARPRDIRYLRADLDVRGLASLISLLALGVRADSGLSSTTLAWVGDPEACDDYVPRQDILDIVQITNVMFADIYRGMVNEHRVIDEKDPVETSRVFSLDELIPPYDNLPMFIIDQFPEMGDVFQELGALTSENAEEYSLLLKIMTVMIFMKFGWTALHMHCLARDFELLSMTSKTKDLHDPALWVLFSKIKLDMYRRTKSGHLTGSWGENERKRSNTRDCWDFMVSGDVIPSAEFLRAPSVEDDTEEDTSEDGYEPDVEDFVHVEYLPAHASD